MKKIILILVILLILIGGYFYFNSKSSKDSLGDNLTEADLNTEEIIKNKSNEIIKTFNSNDFKTFKKLVHPIKGVRFSKDGIVDTKNDLSFTPEAIEKALSENSILLWGYEDGSGDPINKTFKDNFSQYANPDFLTAPKIAYDEALRSGANTINNIKEKYPSAHFVSYHYPFTSTYTNDDGKEVPQELSWISLNIVFEEYQGEYYLVGIVKDNWTI